MALPAFGTDGVRGVANIDLTPEAALALGRAAAGVLVPPSVASVARPRFAIGRDPRRSGPMLEAALAAGLASCGVDVMLLGVVPTPTVAWLCARDHIAGAVISASHNPFFDNGIKFFAPGGLKLSDDAEAEIQRHFHDGLGRAAASVDAASVPTGVDVGSLDAFDVVEDWIDSIVATVDGRRLDGVSVVLDTANGAASTVGPQVFRRLGADVVVLCDEPDGVNINDGCGSTSPAALASAVVEHGADFGLAFDGDADRLIAVDHTGAIVDGDHILCLLAQDWKSTGRLTDDTLVVTVMSNLGLHLAMQSAGITVRQTGVGDRSVLAELGAGGFSLGGEQSGHVICRDLATTGDGVLAAVQLADAIARAGRSLSDLAGEAMTTVPQILRNVRLSTVDPGLLDRIRPELDAAERDVGSQGRVLVRASGTEPLIRVMVEHLDDATAAAICDRLIEIVETAALE